jgi:2-haloacid dehalogenase/putative hydrolase of the HAD superfamily
MDLDGLFVDMYGTLTSGDRAVVESVCADLIRDTGLPLTPRDLGIAWGERFFAALEHANGHVYRTLAAIESASLVETLAWFGQTVDPGPHIARLVDYWRAPPLQPDALEFLRRCPCPVWVVSNADRADLEAAVARLGLPVAGVCTSEDARSYKPHPEIFEEALRRTGWRREAVVHVGDSLHSDVGGAIVAGLRCAWVNRAHRIHDIGTHVPDFELRGLSDLFEYLAPSEPIPE